jgi:Domain of unknown function (DUF4169)
MAEFINLRQARKRADRAKRERDAEQNRLTHGEPKHLRKQRSVEAEKKACELEPHRRTTEDT